MNRAWKGLAFGVVLGVAVVLGGLSQDMEDNARGDDRGLWEVCQ